MNRTGIDNNSEEILYNDICSVIEHTRYRVAVYVNSEASLMNWHIGKRIKEDVLYNKRADYGKEILKRLSQKLIEKYGNGWGFQKLNIVYAPRTFSPRMKFCTQYVHN